jgi:hypothetical protein
MRSIDPSQVWVRHVVRGAEGDVSAKLVGRVYFVREEAIEGEDGLNGRQGWQSAITTTVLRDDGSFTLALPNEAGDDGVLHRERFAVLTQQEDEYEPGEEWLEFVRDPNDVIFVGTPTDAETTRQTVTIKGVDLNVVLSGLLSSDVDVWDAAGPADVLRHYSRMPVLAHGDDTVYSQTTTTGGLEVFSSAIAPLTDIAEDCWEAEARLLWESARPTGANSEVLLDCSETGEPGEGGVSLQVDVYDGSVSLLAGGLGISLDPIKGKLQGLVVPGPVSLRIVVRYDHIFGFVNGELVVECRRPYRRAEAVAPAVQTVWLRNGTASLRGTQVITLADFAGRGAASVIQRRLPGIPPADGLNAQYWNAAGIYAQVEEQTGRQARFWPLTGEDANVERIEPSLNASGATAPNMPGAFIARWSGAVYLDLATSDRQMRLAGVNNEVLRARLYVGRTLRGDESVSNWDTAEAALNSLNLRSYIGESEAGWYPIVIEVASSEPTFSISLEDRVVGGSYAPIPQSRLSPIGVYSDVVRNVNHRQVIGNVADAFGYQWRTLPMSLESGQFPGQLEARSLVGQQTALRIREDDLGVEALVQVVATDVVDGLIADAAGIADPRGSGQLSAQVIDYARARDHLALRQGYESLSEISEAPLLQQRLDSLLVLRSSPNEQVGVRPSGERDLVDVFPLTGVLAKMDWMVGDAPILELERIGVKDESPRQLTSVSWELRPDGVGAPTVGFRSRPRSAKEAMRRLSRAIYSPRQNYQGSKATITGTVGGVDYTGAAIMGAHDAWSRVPLPSNLATIVKAVVVVQAVEGPGWLLNVSGNKPGAPAGSVTTTGRYDVTDLLDAWQDGPYAFARLEGASSGGYILTLELSVIV